MSSRFGEMLLNRRRELGMSIQQVANVIKIRPQIIEFFETGNFASMPPRGYAQGMIASYARYLGLNPREVVGAYFDELYVFERGGSAAGSQFTEGATNPVPRSVSTSGRYLMVDPPPAPNSRYGQRPQQAGYVSDTTSGHVPRRVAGTPRRVESLPPAGSTRGTLRTASGPRGGYGSDSFGAPDRTVRMNRPAGGYGSRSGYGSAAGRGGAQDPAHSRQLSRQGSGGYGGSRGGGRPASGSNRGRGYTGGRGGSSGGFGGDPRLLIGGLVAILVLIVLVIVLLVRSCSSTQPATDAGSASTTQAATEPATDDTSDADDEPADDSDADADAADGEQGDGTDTDADGTSSDPTTDAQTQPATPVEHKIKVTVDEGITTWMEIKLDGQIVYSSQTTGPFEKEYTPTESMTVTVNHPGDVHITDNGDKVDWDTRTSGVGRVTITVPQVDTPATAAAADGTATDGTDTTGTDTDTSAAAAQ